MTFLFVGWGIVPYYPRNCHEQLHLYLCMRLVTRGLIEKSFIEFQNAHLRNLSKIYTPACGIHGIWTPVPEEQLSRT